jgi:hypothetical protein
VKVYKAIIILLLFALLSCEKQIFIKDTEFEKHLVVNSFFQPDSFFKVHVSESGSVFEAGDSSRNLEDASVVLFEEGNLLEELQHLGSGLYGTKQIKATQGINYQIVVKAGEKTVHGFDKIPTKNALEGIEFFKNAGYTSLNTRYHRINLQFEDNPDEKNFYEVILKFEYLDSLLILGKATGISHVYSYDPIIKNEKAVIDYGFNLTSLFFSDELVSGKKYNLPVNFYNIGGDDVNTAFKLIVHFNTISENYYRYKKKLLLYREFELTDIWEDMREPVILYSNIENGYGIFAGYNSFTDTIYSIDP